MKIRFEKDFLLALNEQVEYIAKDKPKAARKFKTDLIKNLRKDLNRPFHFKKSIHFDNEIIRDYVFKGYVCVYLIDTENQLVTIFGFIKYKESL
ncbi:MAG: type II toxin-antitoxin system RelE/ParE family toxin [Flavobacterium sp.]|jgi:mRNA-degrading endonuclease RelE of RelBE toxin-antitoxin system|uniref:type II toxin-antitoxin system RelE/ParE family toxin n=1 Tax=Flavobacterium sp. TaxID=239 RepID=UPI003BA4DB5E